MHTRIHRYAALTFFGAEISEAHYNPAVTLAHLICERLGWTAGDGNDHHMTVNDALKYVGVQTGAAMIAGLCGIWCQRSGAPRTSTRTLTLTWNLWTWTLTLLTWIWTLTWTQTLTCTLNRTV